MPNMTIGQLARAAGVSTQTVRFYEREGILPKPRRRASGYRQYGPPIAERVRFIRAAKEVGFTLKEIAGLLSLRVHCRASCFGVPITSAATGSAHRQPKAALNPTPPTTTAAVGRRVAQSVASQPRNKARPKAAWCRG